MTEKILEEKPSNRERSILEGVIIETTRYPPEEWRSEGKFLDIGSIVSVFTLPSFIKDYRGKENNNLKLVTRFDKNYGQRGYHWEIFIEGEKLESGFPFVCDPMWSFNELYDNLSDYTQDKLKQWQKYAVNIHRTAQLKLEDLYWQRGEIPKDFLLTIPAFNDFRE